MFNVMPPSILQLEKVGIDGKVFFITCLLKNWWLLFLDEVVWFSNLAYGNQKILVVHVIFKEY
jgi:hypothetical protein